MCSTEQSLTISKSPSSSVQSGFIRPLLQFTCLLPLSKILALKANLWRWWCWSVDFSFLPREGSIPQTNYPVPLATVDPAVIQQNTRVLAYIFYFIWFQEPSSFSMPYRERPPSTALLRHHGRKWVGAGARVSRDIAAGSGWWPGGSGWLLSEGEPPERLQLAAPGALL